MPDRLPELYIPKAPASDHRRLPAVLNSMAKPLPEHMAQRLSRRATSLMQAPNVCTTITCRFVAQWLRAKFDQSARPCTNFYKYVCGKFKGGYTQFDKTGDDVIHATIRYAKNTFIPKTKQTFYEKAAGLFQACLGFVKRGALETSHLRDWMISIGIDINDTAKLKQLDPFDMIMRLSLDQGVPALLDITVNDVMIFHKNRLPMIEYNQLLDNWIATSNDSDIDHRTQRTAQLLQLWGDVNSFDDIVSDITKYEELHKWISLFAKYTNNSYDHNGWMLIQPPGLEIVLEMLDTAAVGREGTNYMIFWNLYLQTLFYVVPRYLTAGKNPVEACYEHVEKAVKVALVTPCLQAVLRGESLRHVTKVLQHVKGTIRGSIASSKWFNGSVGTYALQKLDQITLRIGAPDYPNLTLESVADFYKDLPDTNVDVLFTSWIKAVALTARLKWVDKTTYRFDIAKPNAFFDPGTASVVIPAAIIMRPLFFSVETDPLNYGGVGAAQFIQLRLIPDEDAFRKQRGGDFYTPWRVCFVCLIFVTPVVMTTALITVYFYSHQEESVDSTVSFEASLV
ncbi:hypothetical protein HPB50_018844 [Hyalomma asiaticum]|uniref:Uncharacterized protein n=1 Tax=Hyalomma asiaticum TaxID=266040 RepID=A0ACB7SLC6_HYAAI|nr:hypothetical protein HPB50_018844 [Hyalomma asiaticum]